jgi:hypothetical protein
MQKLVKILMFLTLGVIMPVATAQAYGLERAPAHHPVLLARASGVSLDQAVNQVRKQTGGRVLSAKTVSKKGRRFHRIKVLLPSGQVRIVRKPAN